MCRLNDDDDDDGATKVDVIETTREPTEYYHPENPRICLVDLPGIGTPSFLDLPTYCKSVDLANYDKYLIFTSLRFTNYDLQLARKVKSMGKSFFLILEKIKKHCFENVKDYTFPVKVRSSLLVIMIKDHGIFAVWLKLSATCNS